MPVTQNILRGAGSGAGVSQNTAQQWDIKNGKTAHIATGKVTGSGYFPAMMEFNGSSGYYSKTYTSSGNAITAVVKFKMDAFTGGADRRLAALFKTGGYRLVILAYPSDYATSTRRSKLNCICMTAAGVSLANVFTGADVIDGAEHTMFFSYNAATGAANLVIDGADDLDTGNPEHTLTTGTLAAGTNTLVGFGADSAGGFYWLGLAGFLGVRDAYLTNWSDFMQTDGSPKPLDVSTWTEWGAQPLFWHESGMMTENKGSAGAMTKNGTITLAAASSWS